MSSLVPTAYAAVDSAAFSKVIAPVLTHIVNPIVLLLFAVATLVFVYGVIQMIVKGNDPDAVSQGKSAVIGGIIGMFIMLSAWGFIHLISDTVKSL